MVEQEPEEERVTVGGASVVDGLGRRHGRRTAPWLRVVLFAAGVVVGVLVVGLLDVTTPDFAAPSVRSGGASPGGAGPSAGQAPAGAQARVNAACLAVINDAQDVYAALGDLGPALDDDDLTALDDIVRRLQPVEPRLAADLRGCRIDTSVGSSGTTAPGSAPTPLPTGTGPAPPGSTPLPTPTR